MSQYLCRIFPHKIAKLKREKYEQLVAKSPQTYFIEKKKPKKESVDIRLIQTLNKLRKKVLSEAGNKSTRLAAIDRVIDRNVQIPPNNC